MTSDRSFFNPKNLFSYLTKSGSKEEKEPKKKKKRGFLFRKAESRSSLTDNYDYYRSPYKIDAPKEGYSGTSPYDDISPDSFFTDTGVQRDIDFQRKKNASKQPPLIHVPVVPEFEIPDTSRTNRPSLSNVFDVSGTSGKDKNSKTFGNRGSQVVDNTALKLEFEDNEDDELLSPYDEESFHAKSSTKKGESTARQEKIAPQSSNRSLNTDIEIVTRERRRDRDRPSSIEESIVSSAVHSQMSFGDRRVRKEGISTKNYAQTDPGGIQRRDGKLPYYGHPGPFLPQGGYPGYLPPPHMMPYPPPYPYGMPYPGYYPHYVAPVPEEGENEMVARPKAKPAKTRESKERRRNKTNNVKNEIAQQPKSNEPINVDDVFDGMEEVPGLDLKNFLY